MPTSMCRFACAAGTARPAATRTIAAATPIRLRNDRLPSETRKHASQPLFQLNLGLPAEQLARAGDVRLPDLRVVHRQSLVHELALRAGDPEDDLGELVECELGGVADVHGQMLTGLRERNEPTDEVVDVAEAPGLGAVSEHSQRLALKGLPHKRRNRAPVARAHAGPIGVENPGDRGVHALLAVV